GYRMNDGTVCKEFPVGLKALAQVQPIYEELENWEWNDSLGKTRRFEELPTGARRYVELIESYTGVPVTILGVGSERTEAIYRSAIFAG
ncbi:MAG: adenylosuccinate synthetase, partial [Methylohalobius sp.]